MERIKDILLRENTYVFLIALALISIPMPYAYSSITLIILAFVAVSSTYFHKITFQKSLLLPVLMFLLMLVSLIWTINTDKSLRGLERQLPFLVVPIAFICMPRLNMVSFKKILKYFAVALSLIALFLILNSTILYILEGDNAVLSYHGMVDVWELNAIYISVITSLSLLYILFYERRNIFNLIVAAILTVFLLLLSSKNIITVTVLAGLLGIFITWKFSFKKGVLLIFLALGLGITLFYSPLKSRIDEELNSNVKEVLTCEKFNRVYPWTGTTLRIYQARIFFELIQEDDKLFTGYGLNAAQEKIIQKNKQYNLYWGYDEYNFHNQYIQTWAELGILGFLILVFILAALLRGYLNSKEIMFLFALIIMTAIFFTETYVWRQRGMLHFLILFGLLFNVSFQKSTKT